MEWNLPCKFVVDGGWADFGNWSMCSVTCGTGTSTRQRACDNPPAAHGGLPCPGSKTEQKICHLDTCPGRII